MSDEDGTVSVDMQIEDGRTVIDVTGQRDAAMIVRSDSGQRIYLPPEDFDRPAKSERQGVYQSADGDGDSPATGQSDGSPATGQSGGSPATGQSGGSPATGQTDANRAESSPNRTDSPPNRAESPYDSPRPRDSPYQSPDSSDSAYQRAEGRPETQGTHSTADGFRVVHPEPVTDFRLLR
jgi:hypothetical protein